MNAWLATAHALLLPLLLCGLALARPPLAQKLVVFQAASVVAAVLLLLLAVGLGQGYLLDLVLAVVLTSLASTLAAAHFLERWL